MSLSRTRKIQLVQRREKIAELYLQGNTQVQIAEALGIQQSTVSNDLKRVQEHWRESAVRDFDLARETELKRIDRVEREAWGAWERSQKPAQTAVTSDDPHQRRSKRVLKNQHGDPRYLDIVHKCIASRRALLGLDAPTRTEIKTDGIPLDQRRDRITTIVAALCDRRAAAVSGAGPGGDESGQLRATGQPGTVAASPPPQLPGPADPQLT